MYDHSQKVDEYLSCADDAFLTAIEDIHINGEEHNDRTGVGTRRVFGRMFKFNLSESKIPIISCKKAAFKNTVGELLWFLSGSTNVNDLVSIRKQVEPWWRPFANEQGDLGPMYGRQLRNFNGQGVDQVHRVIQQIKEERNSRRILMTTYNPIEAPLGSLYPCHGLLTQFMIDNEDRLHMSTIQRSADTALGLPHNWISYSVLQMMIASVCGLQAGILTYFVNDLHIYNNHLAALLIKMKRKSYSNPTLVIKPRDNIDDYTMDDFTLYDYKSGPIIKLDMAV